MTRTRDTWLAAVAGLTLLLAGCGSGGSAGGTSDVNPPGSPASDATADAPATTSGDSPASDEPASSDSATPLEPASIAFWHSFNSDSPEVKTLEEILIPEFEKQNPGVTVTSVAVPYEDLHQKLVAAVAGNQLPDVVRTDIIWVPELANLGVLEPLDTLMPDFNAVASAVYPGPLATAKWGEHYYGLPLDTNTRVMLSNKAVFDAAGVGIPSTQQQVVDGAAAVKAEGAAIFVDNDLSGWNILPWIWSAGGDITDPAITKADGFINSAATVSAVTLLYDLYKSGGIPPILVQGGKDSYESGVATGSYASMLNGPWAYPIVAADHPDATLTATAVPSGSAGSISVVGGEDIVITKASAHQEAAAAFVSFMLSEQAQRAMAEVGQMPVLSSLGSEMTSIQAYYAAFVSQLATARPRPPTPGWNEIDLAIKTRLQAAFVGDGNIEQAMNDLAPQIDAILAKYPAN